MDTQAQDVRNATDAVATVLDCVAKVRCLVDYHGLDDQLDRLGPMLTNCIAVYFAAQPLLFKAVHRLRAASPELPPRIGKHSAASYHELALHLGNELIWRMLSGMNALCMQAVLDALTGLGQLPNGSISEAESALNELGGIEDPAAVVAEMREHSLTSCDLADLARCVLKEGALAAAAASQTQPPDERKQPVSSYLDVEIDEDTFSRHGIKIVLTGNERTLIKALHAAGPEGLSRNEILRQVFQDMPTPNAFDQTKRRVNPKLLRIGLTMEANGRAIWRLTELRRPDENPD